MIGETLKQSSITALRTTRCQCTRPSIRRSESTSPSVAKPVFYAPIGFGPGPGVLCSNGL